MMFEIESFIILKLRKTNVREYTNDRKDNTVFHFSTCCILGNKSKTYFHYLSQNEFTHSFKWIAMGGNYCKTARRILQMYQYGETIGYSKYPLFRI